jgi:hypothetical protein
MLVVEQAKEVKFGKVSKAVQESQVDEAEVPEAQPP